MNPSYETLERSLRAAQATIEAWEIVAENFGVDIEETREAVYNLASEILTENRRSK